MSSILGYLRVAAAVIAGGLVLLSILLLYVVRQMGKPPENNPEQFLRRGRRPEDEQVVVCLGASIVQGRVCPSFVELLRKGFAGRGYLFVNAGVNGDMSLHVLRRLDRVIACKPDFVVILVGTNDVTGTLNTDTWRAYKGEKSLSGPPTLEAYRENMAQIVRRLRAETNAQVALCSLPVLGEDLTSLGNDRVCEFNAVLREVAEQEHAGYLPVYEREEAYLKEEQAMTNMKGLPYTGDAVESLRMGFLGGVLHYLFGQSYDAISRRRAMLLKTDLIHGNSREAEIIAQAVGEWLVTGSEQRVASAVGHTRR